MKEDILQKFTELNIPISPSYFNVFLELDLCLQQLNSPQKLLSWKEKKPQNLYIYGLTGCGKTTLMNRFFEAANKPKINIHFQDYFIDIAKLLNKYSILEIAKKLKNKVDLLCFDEFFIESIADAKLLNKLFSALIKNNITIVLTSNFSPEELYKNGFNRELAFPKFSNFLNDNFKILNLSTQIDLRTSISQGSNLIVKSTPTHFVEQVLKFKGYQIKCKIHKKEIIIEYSEAFAMPRSTLEYVYICRNFEKIYISNFKNFTKENEDEAIRFRNFIDMAYLRNNVVYLQCNFKKSDIFSPDLLANIKIKRTYSRLIEMSSNSFISKEKTLKRKWQTDAKNLLQAL